MPSNRLPLLLALLSVVSLPAASRDWGDVPSPTSGTPEAIGETGAGCLAGGIRLPTEGEGYKVMHLERNRNYGHPDLIRSIAELGRATVQGHWGELHVGDLSQPRGGPMRFGHRSHQSGIDVDVWFALDPNLVRNADGLRSNIPAPSLLTSDQSRLNHMLWDANHARVLEAAARDHRVDRIFVNAHIKQELCRSVRGDRSWLRKIRPWHRHDDHFHMRLACPANSPDCLPQKPLEPGDGCDASLDWWLSLPPLRPLPDNHHGPAPSPALPRACRAVLTGR